MRARTVDRDAVNAELAQRFGATVTRKNLLDYKAETGIYAVWIRRDPALRLARGLYKVPTGSATITPTPAKSAATKRSLPEFPVVTPEPVAQVGSDSFDAPRVSKSQLMSLSVAERIDALRTEASSLAAVPEKAREFVPFGDFEMIRRVIASRQFYPIFIAGPSGNGKTFGVEQACAMERREYVRVNITMETDEDDLIGGFRLYDGTTVFELGPVVVAMLRGAVLLVDEIGYASPKIACIQSVLEGRSITIKKLGITIKPAAGFQVFATSNSKGRGDDTGKYVGENILNEAFLERFPVTVEQDYPSVAVEKKILAKTFGVLGGTMTSREVTFFETLAKWADAIRTTYAEGGVDDIISTRRLCHIVKGYAIFGDDEQALSYCVNRFDAKTREAFIDLYNKLVPDPGAPSNVGSLDGSDQNAPGF